MKPPTKEQTRAAAPEMAALVDDFRNVFGFDAVKITCLEIPALNFKVGTRTEPQQYTPASDVPMWKQREEWEAEEKQRMKELQRQMPKRKRK